MESRKDFGMLDKADVQMVIKDNQTPAWTGSCDEMPPTELFDQAKKVLLIITAGPDLTAENLNSTLDDIHNKLSDDALFLYTVVEDKTGDMPLKTMLELYINND